ncbi:Hsp70 family protein [Kribbella sancticallisti]|uniref:Hsp70 family protein n=1 Tax=Kribbella sancticallisti TaxID=460087 RepID=A0ABN2CEI4_9ACTN
MNLAVVVGCATYEHPIPSLRFASADARRMADTLRTTCGLQDDEILLLSEDAEDLRSRPTFTNVLRTLSRARQYGRTANLDTLFFFFSGHGYHSVEDGSEYLLLGDSVAEDLERTALAVQTVIARLQEWGPRHLVLLVDACREAVGESKGGAEDEVPGVDVNKLLPTGNIIFSSCSPGQRSYEHQAIGSGIFTAALCEGLSDRGRCRTLHDLNSFVQRRVPELCKLYGKPRQDPVARLEPAEVLALEIVSQTKRSEWRTSLSVGIERRAGRVPPAPIRGLRPKLALDFGTSTTLAALLDSQGRMHAVPAADGRPFVPSVVNFDTDWDYVVGGEALELDRLRPEGTVWYPKRGLGSPLGFTVHDKSLTAEFVCSLIVRSAVKNAEEFLGEPVRGVIASYPASFSIAQTNALQQVLDLAGLEVMRLVPEPSASGMIGPEGSPYVLEDMLIVDIGGGTLDVAVYENAEGVTEVKATHGDGRLGGIDYDEALEKLLLRRVEAQLGSAPLSPFVRNQVKREAMRAKHVLSARESCEVIISDVEGEGGTYHDLQFQVDRAAFETAVRHLDLRVSESIMAVMRERLLRSRVPDTIPSDHDVISALRGLKHVMLCGQASRLPSLVRAISSVTPAPLITSYQNDAVLQGLAAQAGVLEGLRTDQLLLDTIQQGIGVLVESDPGTEGTLPRLARTDEANTVVLDLLRKGTTVPTRRSERVELGGHQPDVTYRLRLVELKSPWSSMGFTPLGVVEFKCPSPAVEVVCDVDANSTMVLHLRDTPGRWERRLLLNRTSGNGLESIVDQRLTGTLDEI